MAGPMRFLDTLNDKFFELIRFDSLISAIRRRPTLWLAIWIAVALLPLAEQRLSASTFPRPVALLSLFVGWALLLGLHVAFALAAGEDMQTRGRDGLAYGLLVFFVPLVGVLLWISSRRIDDVPRSG